MTADEALAGCGSRGFRLEMVERDTGCSSGQGLRAALLAFGRDGAQALLGEWGEVGEGGGKGERRGGGWGGFRLEVVERDTGFSSGQG